MNELEVLELFIDEIESVIPDSVPVRMSEHDEDHEEVMVLLDNLNTNRQLRSTNPYIGVEKDSGSIVGENLQFYFDARLDITIKSEDEVEAYELRSMIQNHHRKYEKYPDDLHSDVVMFEVGDGGQREAQFEPSVFRLFQQTQTFEFAFVNTETVDADVIDEIEDNLD